MQTFGRPDDPVSILQRFEDSISLFVLGVFLVSPSSTAHQGRFLGRCPRIVPAGFLCGQPSAHSNVVGPGGTFRFFAPCTHVHPYLLSQTTSFVHVAGACDIAARVPAPTMRAEERIFSTGFRPRGGSFDPHGEFIGRGPFRVVSVCAVVGSVSLPKVGFVPSRMRRRHSHAFMAAGRVSCARFDPFGTVKTLNQPQKDADCLPNAKKGVHLRRNGARSVEAMAEAHVQDASSRTLVVAGSANADVYCEIMRLPLPGETVDARGYATRPGGKVRRDADDFRHVTSAKRRVLELTRGGNAWRERTKLLPPAGWDIPRASSDAWARMHTRRWCWKRWRAAAWTCRK